MEKVVKVFFLTVFIIALVCPVSYGAQNQDIDQQTSTVTLTIMPVCKLDIANNDISKTITADSTAEPAFIQGYVEFDANKPTLTVDSNKKWKLSVSSTDFTGPYQKDISDLQLKDLSETNVKNGFSDYRSLSNNDQDVAMCNAGVKDETHPLQYKVLLDWTEDVPGTYEATVTYTLSTMGS